MRIVFFALAIFIAMHTQAQTTGFDKTINDRGELVYTGQFSFTRLQEEEEFDWFAKGVEDYKPEAQAMSVLQEELGDYSLVVFMGTWCEDSHNLIPKLYKILQAAEYPVQQLTLFGLNREKKGLGNAHETYKVSFVPTIIVLSEGKEIGRITETVRKSVEADLVVITEGLKEE